MWNDMDILAKLRKNYGKRPTLMERLRNRYPSMEQPSKKRVASNERKVQQFQSSEALVIRNSEDWENFVQRVLDVEDILKHLSKQPSTDSVRTYQTSLKNYIEKMKIALSTPDEIDEYSTENMADKLVSNLAKRLRRTIMVSCHRKIKSNDWPGSKFYEELQERIDDYLKRLGFRKIRLNVGSSFCGQEIKVEKTPHPCDNPELWDIIEEVETSPYCLRYKDLYGDTKQLYLQAACVVYDRPEVKELAYDGL